MLFLAFGDTMTSVFVKEDRDENVDKTQVVRGSITITIFGIN